MNDNVEAMFEPVTRDMGQCPACRGYMVQLNFARGLLERYPDDPRLKRMAIEEEGTGYHCLNCDYRW
jgi:ssDNA-binding Zn-finger/Zn-ribbon topoisomerase 1